MLSQTTSPTLSLSGAEPWNSAGKSGSLESHEDKRRKKKMQDSQNEQRTKIKTAVWLENIQEKCIWALCLIQYVATHASGLVTVSVKVEIGLYFLRAP